MAFACEQSDLFTNARAEPIAAEYVFTAAVAMAIAELNGPPGEPYVIRVERDATTFATDCLRPLRFAHPNASGGSRLIRRGKPDVGRPGRVDVTVYTDSFNSGYFGVQPLCAIELKGFDPGANVVLADLQRNLSFLRVKGDTGESVLEFAVFAAFHSYGQWEDRHILQNERRVKKKYKKYLMRLGDLTDIDAVIKVKSVSVEQVGTVIQGIDYDELDASSRHHFVGACVIMSRLAGMPPHP